MTFEDDNIDLRSNEFAGRIKCNTYDCGWNFYQNYKQPYCWFRTSEKSKAKPYCNFFKNRFKELDLF